MGRDRPDMESQVAITKEIVEWINENRWSQTLTICTEGSLFIGDVRWETQIDVVDILVREESPNPHVALLIEVEPICNPKKVLGQCVAAVLADQHTPPRQKRRYPIQDTVYIWVGVVSKTKSTKETRKRMKLELVEKTIREKIDLARNGLRAVEFCVGGSDAESIEQCKRAIQQYWPAGNNPKP